jgi:hypothetical protein
MQNEATKLANLNKHLEDIDKKCLEQSEKILTNGNLTPDEIVVMQRKQLEYNTPTLWGSTFMPPTTTASAAGTSATRQ